MLLFFVSFSALAEEPLETPPTEVSPEKESSSSPPSETPEKSHPHTVDSPSEESPPDDSSFGDTSDAPVEKNLSEKRGEEALSGDDSAPEALSTQESAPEDLFQEELPVDDFSGDSLDEEIPTDGESGLFDTYIALQVRKNRGDHFYKVVVDEEERPYLDVENVLTVWLEMVGSCDVEKLSCKAVSFI